MEATSTAVEDRKQGKRGGRLEGKERKSQGLIKGGGQCRRPKTLGAVKRKTNRTCLLRGKNREGKRKSPHSLKGRKRKKREAKKDGQTHQEGHLERERRKGTLSRHWTPGQDPNQRKKKPVLTVFTGPDHGRLFSKRGPRPQDRKIQPGIPLVKTRRGGETLGDAPGPTKAQPR